LVNKPKITWQQVIGFVMLKRGKTDRREKSKILLQQTNNNFEIILKIKTSIFN
jgi:hypothetical protein